MKSDFPKDEAATRMDQGVTEWFYAMRGGDESAARRLWQTYCARLKLLARNRLPRDPVYDEEDLAISVFNGVFQASQNGKYAGISNRDELWRLLARIAKNKTIDRNRRALAQRRAATKFEQIPAEFCSLESVSSKDQPVCEELDFVDHLQKLLTLLDCKTLEEIAVLRLDGYTAAEIAERIDSSERTVKRRLAIIRKRWEMELPGCGDS